MIPVPSLQDILWRWNQQPAWETGAGTLSFAELEQKILNYAAAMPSKKGECWAIAGLPALETFAILLAGMCRGSLMFLLPDRLPTKSQELMLAQAPIVGVFCSAAHPPLPYPRIEIFGDCVPGSVREESLQFDSAAAAVGIFTSGSTGTPKAVIHSWASLCSSAQATVDFYPVKACDSWLLSLDLAHIGGLQIAMRCLLAGAICLHFAEPKNLLPILLRYSPQFVSLVPTQLYRMLDQPEVLARLRACKAIVLGGAAASWNLLRLAQDAKLPVSVSYGSSETAAQCTALLPFVYPEHPGDVGEVLSHWDMQHHGEELRLRGPAAMLGIYSQGQFTSGKDQEGWLTLPDRILCKTRRITVLGRSDGLFQVGGENIAAADILGPLDSLRSFADFLLIPVDDEEYGKLPVLIVRSIQKPDPQVILDLWHGNLSGIQRPRKIYWHESDEISKPSRGYYEFALQRADLALIWSQELGRI